MSSNLSRRELIELGLASGVLAFAPSARGQEARATRSAAPKNIIFMVADGMSVGVPTLAEPFSQLLRKQETQWRRLARSPQTTLGLFDMASLNSLVTDSAAAASSWGSGVRIFNGALNMLPDGRKLATLAQVAHAAGRLTGLVTTTTITHATPAGFCACQANRDDEHDIAPQYAGVVDVLMGGGAKFFEPALREDKRDIWAEYAAQGYTLWKSREEMLGGTRPPRVLGVFSNKHLPFTLDRQQSSKLQETVPTLAEMTTRALAILSAGENGFLLQVEGGRVDHAAHVNDAGAILWEQLAFDDAVGVAVHFAETRGDTLVVVTTDHGNSNPGLDGMGEEYRDSTRCFSLLAGSRASFERIVEELNAAHQSGTLTAEGTAALLGRMTGIELTTKEAQAVFDAVAGDTKSEIFGQHRNIAGILGQTLGNHHGIGWTGMTHTADLVQILAIGPGRERFAGLIRNTSAYDHITSLLGIRHPNPQMTPEEAQKFAGALPRRRGSDWA